MATVEEIDILDSGMGSSDMRSPEVKSILPGVEEEEEVNKSLFKIFQSKKVSD